MQTQLLVQGHVRKAATNLIETFNAQDKPPTTMLYALSLNKQVGVVDASGSSLIFLPS